MNELHNNYNLFIIIRIIYLKESDARLLVHVLNFYWTVGNVMR